jgi:hypothetical protein
MFSKLSNRSTSVVTYVCLACGTLLFSVAEPLTPQCAIGSCGPEDPCPSGQACCGGTCYDPNYSGCCGGQVYDLATQCCVDE